MSNPIMPLLSKDVLTSDNFPKWKSNLNIVLVSESLRFILIEERPVLPAPNASKNLREDYDKWVMANKKAMAYMLASIFDALRTKWKGIRLPWKSLTRCRKYLGCKASEPAKSSPVSALALGWLWEPR